MLYLSCEDSAGVTGSMQLVDGGYLAAAEYGAKRINLLVDGRSVAGQHDGLAGLGWSFASCQWHHAG